MKDIYNLLSNITYKICDVMYSFIYSDQQRIYTITRRE